MKVYAIIRDPHDDNPWPIEFYSTREAAERRCDALRDNSREVGGYRVSSDGQRSFGGWTIEEFDVWEQTP